MELGAVVLGGASVVAFAIEFVVWGSSVVSNSPLCVVSLLSVVKAVHPASSG